MFVSARFSMMFILTSTTHNTPVVRSIISKAKRQRCHIDYTHAPLRKRLKHDPHHAASARSLSLSLMLSECSPKERTTRVPCSSAFASHVAFSCAPTFNRSGHPPKRTHTHTEHSELRAHHRQPVLVARSHGTLCMCVRFVVVFQSSSQEGAGVLWVLCTR